MACGDRYQAAAVFKQPALSIDPVTLLREE
jgi:hypothetical protein